MAKLTSVEAENCDASQQFAHHRTSVEPDRRNNGRQQLSAQTEHPDQRYSFICPIVDKYSKKRSVVVVREDHSNSHPYLYVKLLCQVINFLHIELLLEVIDGKKELMRMKIFS
ncbi:hypothetical protein T07_7301 [Trichinella nelsoni]|uniref:Uncharacterized protein n=1 Tax=Trichinella nelsoni TaxID=6336 RepID=A0A0V0S404_9BILA|nr:hypothetical protein T07_7301 [Trichinella nelsoni]